MRKAQDQVWAACVNIEITKAIRIDSAPLAANRALKQGGAWASRNRSRVWSMLRGDFSNLSERKLMDMV